MLLLLVTATGTTTSATTTTLLPQHPYLPLLTTRTNTFLAIQTTSLSISWFALVSSSSSCSSCSSSSSSSTFFFPPLLRLCLATLSGVIKIFSKIRQNLFENLSKSRNSFALNFSNRVSVFWRRQTDREKKKTDKSEEGKRIVVG